MRTALATPPFLLLPIGCKPPAGLMPTPKKSVTVDTLPWAVDEANQNLKGMTKEELIAILGKPSGVWGNQYYYTELKYLKPDIGDRDQSPGGMTVHFTSLGAVDGVMFSRR